MNIVLRVVAGAVLGCLYVGLAGIIGMQAFGARVGATFSLKIEPIMAGPQSVPYLPYAVGGVLGAVFIYVLFAVFAVFAARNRTHSAALNFGFSVTLVLIGLQHTSYGPDYELLPWGLGWIQRASLESAVHVLAVASFGFAIWQLLRRGREVRSGRDGLSEPAV
ncbi:hypothetical protein JSO19_03680 [Leucobacter sp. UCMA 4100]|uniref:hypothetical protein n=1 Tax=Leucobacter sp. UCMA 4100 TaxID=2810534 RepID=UPI0022EB4C0C|nr:hypothetical protein [Leucobacter sp. UCMA 4100]MDA3146476.1 hypothetical protein [Leucobacter sp. UCMA 4100]